jgi:hypothetical protein
MLKASTMKFFLTTCAFVLATAGVVRAEPCVPGGLAIIVSKANPVETLSPTQLRKLMMGDVKTWPDGKAVTLVNLDPASPVFKCVLSAIVRMSDPEYKKYLLNAEFRGEQPVAVKVVDSAASAAKIVTASAGALSVVDASALAALGGTVKVLRINGKQPGEAGYPL